MQAHVQKLQLLKEEERDGLLLNPNCLQDKAIDKGEECKDNKIVLKDLDLG